MARHRHPHTVGLPFNAWPEVDRTAWLEAIREGDILSEAGRAAHWRSKTRHTVRKAYGNYLRFLAEMGALDPSAPIAARLSEQHLRDYIAELRRRTAPRTVSTQLRSLSQAFAALAPQADRQLLLHAIARLNRVPSPGKSRSTPLPSPIALKELGYQLMATWRARVAHDPRLNAMDYRDGLMIAFLALCPLRLENLASIRIGHQLRIGSAGARVVIDGAETKNGRPIDVEFPADLMSALKIYLEEIHPQLYEGEQHGAPLWPSLAKGKPMMTAHGIYTRITQVTAKALGYPVSPHMFRHAAATFIAEVAPERAMMASAVLHHASLETAMAYYVHGQQHLCARKYQAAIDELCAEFEETSIETMGRDKR